MGEMKLGEKLLVSPAPHISSGASTKKIMLTVIIALLPSVIASVIIFGINALILTLITVASCVLFEFLFNKILKREQTIEDLSAVVTGIILALNLPFTLQYYMAVIGAFFAIVIVKMLFGGIGQNFVNPAIAARIFLLLAFSAQMSTFYAHENGVLVATATPLAILDQGGDMPTYLKLFIGNHGGSMSEGSILSILIGLGVLTFTKTASPIAPLSFLGSMALIALIAGKDPLLEIMIGGAAFGAVFMATDYTTAPITASGKAIFGLGCGVITMMIRLFGNYPEGVSYAILLMNIVTPYIDRLTRPKPFGKVEVAK